MKWDQVGQIWHGISTDLCMPHYSDVMYSFTGVSHYTKIVENSEDNAWFDETFQWPVARPIEREEYIDIQLYNYNKYLSNK